MYKYSWKAALMTFCMMGVGKIALADGESKEQELGLGSKDVASNNFNLLDDPIAIGIIIGLVILVLLLVFMLVWAQNRFAHTNRTINNLLEKLNDHQRLLESLKSRMDDMNEVPVQSTVARGQYAESPFKQNFSPLMQPQSMPVQAQNIPEPKPNLSEKLWQKSMEFAEEYNRIQTITGMGAREAKLEFQRKYKLCGFVCINSTERINHPEKEPQFQLRDSLLDSAIWGFEIGNFYVVAPNPRQYVGDDHNYGGMKELFESNFQPGRTYNKIKINSVAIMTHDLQIHKKGNLQLS